MSVLKSELQNDPKQMGYLSHLPDCPGLVADMLNRPDQRGIASRYVNARTVLSELGAFGITILEAMRAAAPTVPALYWILPFISVESGVDVGHPFSQSMIDSLQTGGVFTEAQATALKGMAIQDISRAQQIGLGHVTALDVTNAFLE